MRTVRRVGAAVLAVAAATVWFAMAPEDVQATDRAAQIDQALSDYEQNEARTTGAPQQTVVNGWVAKDLLAVIARLENDQLGPAGAQSDERVPALMGLGVLGLALGLATSPGSPPTAGAAGPTAPAAPGGGGPPHGPEQLREPDLRTAQRVQPSAEFRHLYAQ